LKPKIVVSGVNLVEFGLLSIFRDALRSLVDEYGDEYEIIALVHREGLLSVSGVSYLAFPQIKGSWLRRVKFEYLDCLKLSRCLNPVLWIALHDMTPRVSCQRQVVYCHNPSPFYRFRLRDAFLDPTFGLFTLFYRYLYKMFLNRNEAVIVQQDWLRNSFEEHYGAKHVIVASPTVEAVPVPDSLQARTVDDPYRFCYPALSRTFKNHEQLLEAVRLLEARGLTGFELVLTVNSASNRCGADLFRRYSGLRSVRWLGSVSREKVYEIYGQSDCLVFPSKLETWGLPLTEFKTTGKPILAVDLPYAHETIGSYDKVAFFAAEDVNALATQMGDAIQGNLQLQTVVAAPIAAPYAKDWQELWTLLLPRTSDEAIQR